MKLSINTDFTKFPRAEKVLAAGEATGAADAGIELAHDERRLRRKALPLGDGSRILVDFLEPVTLRAGDRLVLDDGRQVEVRAAPEELLEIVPRDPVHLAELAWHIGNRHLAAAIEANRILILHDHVIDDMLKGLGAEVRHVVAPFEPLRGAYGGHSHGHEDHGHHEHGHHDHDHGHDHHHGHDHDHGGHAHGHRHD
jgi:urease accessory protein